MSDVEWIRRPVLRRPILVVAFTGLFDAASAATGATSHLVELHRGDVVARIAAEEFFVFTEQRPMVRLDDVGDRHIDWPDNDFAAAYVPGRPHDLVLVSGIEPHLRWRHFADAIVTVAKELGCEMCVTLGAVPDVVPHTRPSLVFGSSTNAELVRRLGLSTPRYEGPTGVIGVLLDALDRAGVPAISLRAPVPHYAMTFPNPRATVALLEQLQRMLNVPTGAERLAPLVAEWQARHNEAVAGNEQAAAYVPRLEQQYDQRVEAAAVDGDAIASEIEAFLRDQHND